MSLIQIFLSFYGKKTTKNVKKIPKIPQFCVPHPVATPKSPKSKKFQFQGIFFSKICGFIPNKPPKYPGITNEHQEKVKVRNSDFFCHFYNQKTTKNVKKKVRKTHKM